MEKPWPIEIDGLPFLKMVDLSMAMLNNQMVLIFDGAFSGLGILHGIFRDFPDLFWCSEMGVDVVKWEYHALSFFWDDKENTGIIWKIVYMIVYILR